MPPRRLRIVATLPFLRRSRPRRRTAAGQGLASNLSSASWPSRPAAIVLRARGPDSLTGGRPAEALDWGLDRSLLPTPARLLRRRLLDHQPIPSPSVSQAARPRRPRAASGQKQDRKPSSTSPWPAPASGGRGPRPSLLRRGRSGRFPAPHHRLSLALSHLVVASPIRQQTPPTSHLRPWSSPSALPRPPPSPVPPSRQPPSSRYSSLTLSFRLAAFGYNTARPCPPENA